MTRYRREPATPVDRGDGTMVYHDTRDWPGAPLAIIGMDYEPATPNPDDETETYRPVTLAWFIPGNGIYATTWTAHNGHRGNRVYTLSADYNGNNWQVRVNGTHIPVTFESVSAAKLFAQAIEDANTED